MGMGARLVDMPTQDEQDQALAEFGEDVRRSLELAKSGQATAEDWDNISFACGLFMPSVKASGAVEAMEEIPF